MEYCRLFDLLLTDLENLIVGLSISIFVVLCIISYLVYYFVFSRKRKIKRIKEVDTKYQYYHSLLIGECFQILQRLEIISHANLVYSQYHSENLKKYIDILNREDKNTSKSIEILDDYILDSKKKGFKNCYSVAKTNLDKFKNVVISLNEELLEIIKPEEDARNKALVVKEYAAVIKKKYMQNNDSFEIASQTFDKIFNAIDKKFELFNTLIDSAEYESALNILPKIKKVLEELNRIIDILPNTYIEANDKIPAKIESIISKYDSLDQNKIPLNHLAPKKTIKAFKDEKNSILDLIKNLKMDEATKRIKSLEDKLDEFVVLLQKEEDSKVFYDENFTTIYDYANSLGKKIINLYNEIPNIKKVYLFDGAHQNILEKFQSEEKELTDAKRNVDVNLLTTTRQPFSIVIEKLVILKNASEEVNNSLQAFNTYILSLKEDCDNAYKLISKEYSNLRYYFVKYDLLKTRSTDTTDTFEHLYELLDEIVSLIKTKPVDVIALNRSVNEYKTISETLFIDIKRLLDEKTQCEKYFLLLNKIRDDFDNVEADLNAAEDLFNKSQYKESNIILEKLYKEHMNIL